MVGGVEGPGAVRRLRAEVRRRRRRLALRGRDTAAAAVHDGECHQNLAQLQHQCARMFFSCHLGKLGDGARSAKTRFRGSVTPPLCVKTGPTTTNSGVSGAYKPRRA